MDLTTLQTELTNLGVVDYLTEENNGLYISVKNIIQTSQTFSDFNNIVITNILPFYPSVETITIEGGSIKAIFKLA